MNKSKEGTRSKEGASKALLVGGSLLLLLVVALVLGAQAIGTFLHPQLTPSEERRWKHVEELGAPSSIQTGDELLLDAILVNHRAPPQVWKADAPTIDRGQLHPQQEAALQLFVRWADNDGSMLMPACGALRGPRADERAGAGLQGTNLAMMTMTVAQEGDERLLHAVAHFSRQLSERDAFGWLTALRIRNQLARWHLARKLKPDDDLKLEPAKPVAQYRVLAHEALCDEEILLSLQNYRMQEGRDKGEPAFFIVSRDRELSLHRKFMGALLAPPQLSTDQLRERYFEIDGRMSYAVLPRNYRLVSLERTMVLEAEFDKLQSQLDQL